MAYYCFKCGKELSLSKDAHVGRREDCPSCRADLHACLNCEFYDQKAYNECKEPQADRVLDKDRGNFCDYFKFREGSRKAGAKDEKAEAKKKLDDLFK